MVNEKGREKKYKDKEWDMTSFFIPETFRKYWKLISRLSQVDNNKEFRKYCEEVEKVDLSKKKQGKRGLYMRWVLAKHILKNVHLLKGSN